MNSFLGQLREGIDPRGPLQSYRKALEVWTLVQDHDSWVECHVVAGMSLFALQPLGPNEIDEAISHLEAAEPDEPFLASPLLAQLYRVRLHGDPLENWRNRTKQLELAQSQFSREAQPVEWAKVENELAVASAEEPDGDFFTIMAKRRERRSSTFSCALISVLAIAV
jgi:hypothetical protein